MQISQGKYVGQVMSQKGQLKAIQLETADGKLTIKLPRALRAIAQQELTIGNSLRVWTSTEKKSTADNKDSKKQSKLSAIQIIPLEPRADVSATSTPKTTAKSTSEKLGERPNKVNKKLAKKKKAKDKKSKASKRKASKDKASKVADITVQLCQKKNCCKKGGDELWEAFETAQKRTHKEQGGSFKLKAVGCLGGCKRGPNLRVMPRNTKHYHVRPKEIAELLAKHGA
ncbi:MAG: (2Fe-2S) ferredoxin domain-containing protein [Cyanobacteria bacterium J06649_4]